MKKEFEKIRDAFKKVRKDIERLNLMITESSGLFKEDYAKVMKEIEDIKKGLNGLKGEAIVNGYKKEFEEIKAEVDEIKRAHDKFCEIIDKVYEHDKQLKDFDYRLNSSELEIFLLKEKLKEKEKMVEKFKEDTKLLLEVVQDLAELEEKLIKNGN